MTKNFNKQSCAPHLELPKQKSVVISMIKKEVDNEQVCDDSEFIALLESPIGPKYIPKLSILGKIKQKLKKLFLSLNK